jgi:hypothetical protein
MPRHPRISALRNTRQRCLPSINEKEKGRTITLAASSSTSNNSTNETTTLPRHSNSIGDTLHELRVRTRSSIIDSPCDAHVDDKLKRYKAIPIGVMEGDGELECLFEVTDTGIGTVLSKL